MTTHSSPPAHEPPPHSDDQTPLSPFGFQDVDASEKPRLVRAVFDSVANRYDLMNDLMSAGVHRLWKAALIDWLRPQPDHAYLDVAGGTGDVAFGILSRLHRRRTGGGDRPSGRLTVCDINTAMLDVGRARAGGKPGAEFIEWITGDAQGLPFGDRQFDGYTIAFGIRNVTHIDRALAEAYRVLRPGGRFLCLEFSQVQIPGLDRLYERYSFDIVPRLGAWVTGDGAAYRYLVESIRRFPDQDQFRSMIEAAGFRRCAVRNLSGGIVALHSGWRL